MIAVTSHVVQTEYFFVMNEILSLFVPFPSTYNNQGNDFCSLVHLFVMLNAQKPCEPPFKNHEPRRNKSNVMLLLLVF